MNIKIKKLNENSIIPSYAHPDDAGLDLYTAKDAYIKTQNTTVLIHTGIAIEIPEGYVGIIMDKSGISSKYGLKVLGGVIDSGYRGEIMVCLANIGNINLKIVKGIKIAQMLIQKVEHPTIETVETLSESDRATGGFGSTGK
jgi:dUTP pyrophosphatase